MELRPLPASSVWWILGSLLTLAAATTTVLLLAFGDGDAGDKVRLEAIRLAGTIVLGTGGGAALFVAMRRQRTTELDLVHKLAEAKATQHDAEQRRVTELYTAAAEQLGHESAAVRLAGLYALQRLGQDHPEQRRPIVNVWCAYLRMPFRDPDAEGLDEQERAERRQELEVRLTVLRLLREHVHSGPQGDEPASVRFWGDELDVDLSGATLYELRLIRCRIHPSTTFNDATFIGIASFHDATFTGPARFRGARFIGAASFSRATFTGPAVFRAARFGGRARFDGATFRIVAFTEVLFCGNADFEGATFARGPGFLRAWARRDRQHIWPTRFQLIPAAAGEVPGGEDADVPWGRLRPTPPAKADETPAESTQP